MDINEKTARLITALRPQSKSLLMTIFGDAIAIRGGCASIASLIYAANIFGISARNVRTAILRLANDGWLQSQRRGRYSDYSLSDNCRRQFAHAHERIYAAEAGARSNKGWLLLLPGRLSGNAFRRLRHQLRWSGFAAAGSGVLVCPGSIPPDLLNELKVADEVVLFAHARTDSPAMAHLVNASWGIDDINIRYQIFGKTLKNMEKISTMQQLSATDAFALRTLLIHEYRRVLLFDPLLPRHLLPENWLGEAAHDNCARLYKALTVQADQFIRQHLSAGGQPLPAPAKFYYQRFGGLPK